MNQAIRHDLFGLTKTPFLNDPKEPFLDDLRRRHLDSLARFVQRRGFAAVAGRPGSGKTALIRYFTEALHQPSHKLVYMPFTNLSDNDLLKALCSRLDCEPPHNRNRVVNAIQARIRDLQPTNPVLILDEMQNATPALMETVRLLANDNFDATSRISCILVGTNEFFAKLRMAINESLRQRITLFCKVTELSRPEVGRYLQHCLSDAGAEHQIFDPQAVQLISEVSGGVIRLVKQVAAAAMADASDAQSANVTIEHVNRATEHCLMPLPEVER
jgi:general secretion pathway protein A